MRPRVTEAPPKLEGSPRAVLIDRHPLWLDIVERAMTKLGVDVVGKFTSPDRGVAALEEVKPAVLVIDIAVREPAAEGEAEGVDYIRRAVELVPDLKAVVFSNEQDRGLIDAALAAGASAYVVKTVQPDDFILAIRQVFTRSLHFAVGHANSTTFSPEKEAQNSGLTPREIEILRLVAEGLTNTHVAQTVFVTEQTVKFHLSNIYRKLGLANRTEASRWAQVHGLLQHGNYERVAR